MRPYRSIPISVFCALGLVAHGQLITQSGTAITVDASTSLRIDEAVIWSIASGANVVNNGEITLMPLASIDEALGSPIVGNGSERITTHASAWLNLYDGRALEEMILPTKNHSPILPKRDRARRAHLEMLNVYPNPSHGAVYLVAHLPEGIENATVRVMDPLGRVVLEQQVSGLVQVIELDKPDMAMGFYAAGLFAEGVRVGVTKFEVIR